MHWYWLNIFRYFSTELWPLIDVRILFPLYILFLLSLLMNFSCYGNLKFHWRTMGKVKIEIYCHLIADILTKVLHKCLLSSPLSKIPFFCSYLLIWLVTMATNRQNCKNISKNQLLRSCMGDIGELCSIVSNISLYKKIVFIVVGHELWLLWQLKVSIDLQWEKWKLRLQIIWQKFYRNVCWVSSTNYIILVQTSKF